MKMTRYMTLLILAAFIIAARTNAAVGEWYAVTIYPLISCALSFAVSRIPFSMEEMLVVGTGIIIIVLAIRGIIQKRLKTIFIIAEIIIWAIIWFYLGWGMNYFRESIYSRGKIERQQFEEDIFEKFLQDYADNLNGSYVEMPENLEYDDFAADIKERYEKVPAQYGLSEPKSWQNPKNLIFNRLYSAVGVVGYIGPFFSEIQVNEDVLPGQKAFSYAHELSHLLGVSNEDEANFWAYQICRHSNIPEVRYSGYYSLLPYVLSNASRILSEDEYKEYQQQIRPEILQQLIDQQNYWKARYSKTLGEIQSRMYDAMLKGNKISSGTKNYMQVIDLIIATEYSVRKETIKTLATKTLSNVAGDI